MCCVCWWTVLVISVIAVNSLSSATPASSWPEGLYGLPKPIDGCPRTNTVTWETGLLFQDCEDTKPKTSRSPSYHLAGFVTRDVQQEFCIKTSTLDDTMNPPWPSGQYCIYQKGIQCPPGLESGWVVWDDESQIIGTNKNTHNGTLPKGIYNTDTKMYFCCSTRGKKQVAIDLPVFSPFYLIAFRNSVCQSVRGTTVAREFIYYETEYYTLVTKNDYGGAHPYRATKTRYGHTIYYCYYTPNYCSPLSNAINGKLHPPRCVQTKANVFNDTCTVQCNPGFIPRDITFARSVCRENGRWNSTLVTDCIPAPTTTSTTLQPQTNTSTTENTITSDNSRVTAVTTQQTTLSSRSQTSPKTATKTGVFTISPSTSQKTDREGNNQAMSGDDTGWSSVGRIIAGSICGGVVALGVMFIIFISHCRAKKNNKARQSTLNKCKSLEELVAGRNIIMNRATSSVNLNYVDPMNCKVHYTVVKTDENPLYERMNCEIQYTEVKTDENPLYESIDRRPQKPPDRITDNVLYESLSTLFSDTFKDLDEEPSCHYKPTTL